MNLRDRPGYREMLRECAEAQVQESLNNECAFLTDVLRERIGRFPVEPLTLRHLVILRLGGSPFIGPGDIELNHVAQFLWVISPFYHPKARLHRWFFLKLVRRRDPDKLIEGILHYLDEAFANAPGSTGKHSRATYSAAAAMIDLFAAEYGWPIEKIMATPVKVLFQLRKARCRRLGIQDGGGSPSDRIRQQWLDNYNANRN